MTRRDYVKLAGAVNTVATDPRCDWFTVERMVEALAVVLYADNERFSRERFRAAAYAGINTGRDNSGTDATYATRNRPLSSERETVEERLARLAHLIDSPAFALTEDDVRYDYATGRDRYA